MATFYDNLRNARELPSWGVLPTRGDMQIKKQQDFKEQRARDIAERIVDNEVDAAERAYADEQAKITEPLRAAIREASGGKILIDRSIYDKAKLERILETIKEMQKLNGEALQIPYVVISDGVTEEKNLGEMWPRITYDNKILPFLKNYQLSPSNEYNGTKNSPYRIGLKYSNDTSNNDLLARMAAENNWTIEKPTKEGIESAVHAHELAHTTYYDALRKTQNPSLAGYQDKAKIEEFRQTHPSLQEIFDIAARNTGHNTVQEAAATISGYALQDAQKDNKKGGLDASKNWSPSYGRLPELFAEAYVDCLFNKDNASDYSKEIIKLYTNYVNDYNKTFNNGKTLLNQELFPIGLNQQSFIDNLRKSRN